MRQHSVSSLSRRVRLRLLLRRILRRDTSSPKLLLLAALAGIVTGLVCCGFELALDAVVSTRLAWLQELPSLWCWEEPLSAEP